MEDGGARRRLQFCNETYKDKTFYVDVKTKSMHNRVSSAITQLGGTVESFLSKDIFMLITDAKTSRLQNHLSKTNQDVHSTAASTDVSLSLYSPSTGTESQNSPGVGSHSVSVMSRGRALLMKARQNSKDCIPTNSNNSTLTTDNTSVNSGSSSAVMKAFQMGLKIEHAINFLRKCKSIGVSFKPGKKSKNGELHGFTPLKWDDKDFIKVEDVSKQFRPVFKHIENLPKLYTDNYGGSPFDGPTFLHKAQSEVTTRKEMKGRKFTQGKGGYCEMCEVWFPKSLNEHMLSSIHVNFVKNQDNFSALDILVGQLPNVSNFLAKFAPGINHNVDKHSSYHSQLEVDRFHNVDTLVTNTLQGDMHRLEIEKIPSPNSTCTDAKELSFSNKELFSLQVFSDDKLFDHDVLKNDQDANMFSSNLSQSESPTNILKDLLLNWTLQDNAKPSLPVEELLSENIPNPVASAVTSVPEQHMCSNSVYNNKEVPMSLGTPILSLGCDEEMSDDSGQLKLKLVYEKVGSIASTHLSNHLSERFLKKKRRKLRNVKTRNKENDIIYSSRKTSDTKLKLSKVPVTPIQQTCNLKMFWQVRKTGDCKLVFSSKKRKNIDSDASGRETEEDKQVRPLKRHRLVF